MHPDNPRRGNVEQLRESIRLNGWWGVLVAQRSTGRILVGNHRFAAGVAESMSTFPTHWLDCDDETARRVLLADNRTSDLASWDESELAALLVDMETLAGSAFSQHDLERLLDAAAPDEFQTLDESLSTEHECPKCHFRWSGTSRAAVKADE